MRQLYGYAVSNHSLYVLTGSFFNPALFRLFGHDTSGLSASMADQEGEILCSDRNDGKGWKKVMDKVGAMVAGGVMLLIFVCFRQE